MKYLNQIDNNNKIETRGDLTIKGNVGEKAEIFLENGSLIIEGNVEKAAKIVITNLEMLREHVEFKLVIMGSVSDGVTIQSDAEIIIHNNVGNNCKIASTYAGFKAMDIGESTTIAVGKQITIQNTKDKCFLYSFQGGLIANNLGNEVTIKVCKKIILNKTGDDCKIFTSEEDINADSFGKFNIIHARGSINVNRVDMYSYIDSAQGEVIAESIGDSVNLKAHLNIKIKNRASNNNLICETGKIYIEETESSLESVPIFCKTFAQCNKTLTRSNDNNEDNAKKAEKLKTIGIFPVQQPPRQNDSNKTEPNVSGLKF